MIACRRRRDTNLYCFPKNLSVPPEQTMFESLTTVARRHRTLAPSAEGNMFKYIVVYLEIILSDCKRRIVIMYCQQRYIYTYMSHDTTFTLSEE